jgi:phosphatidylglycerophosphate synthase
MTSSIEHEGATTSGVSLVSPGSCAAAADGNATTLSAERTLPVGWKHRLEDPSNTYYRYPVARLIVRVLMHTRVTPNQVTLVQPFLAAIAGYLIHFGDATHLLLAALVFEVRSILDCVDGGLARAKNMSSPWGHAIDGLADWLSTVLLYGGIFWHFHLHPPQEGPWSAYLSTNGILLLVMFQAATRSFAADYYKTKYISIFERGCDETVEALRTKVLALNPTSSFFAHAEVFIGRMGHLAFEHEWFDPHRSESSTSEEHLRELVRKESSPMTKFVAVVWSLSNGDTFLTLVIVTAAFNVLWEGQVFFATVGLAWIFAVIFFNGWFVRSASRRAKLAMA